MRGQIGDADLLGRLFAYSALDASYRRLASRTASYPAVRQATAASDMTSVSGDLTCHHLKMMHRFVGSHVNSICHYPGASA